MLVKVHEFLLPADFVVMDSERVSLGCKELSIIFGRAKVDVKAKKLSMNVLGKMIVNEILMMTSYPKEEAECPMMDVLYEPIQRTIQGSYSHDFLDLVLTNDTYMSLDYLHYLLTRDVMKDMISSMEATLSYQVSLFHDLNVYLLQPSSFYYAGT